MATTAPALGALPGSLLLFRYREIPVFLHWSWLLAAAVVVALRSDAYSSVVFNILEYVGLFAIVLLHEFGHALATRSVGGSVSHILLWPLGGVAHVRPPQRPAAVLWSIAAGPLVNFVLAPISLAALLLVPEGWTDVQQFLWALAAINGILFVFNMLPVYPLDGGQILRAVLWFGMGRERSLVVTAGLGLIVACIGGAWALDPAGIGDPEGWTPDIWLALIAAYAGYHSWRGLRAARLLQQLAAGPRHVGTRCPSCGEAPPAGLAFRCDNDHLYDAFDTGGRCPQCGDEVEAIRCLFCGEAHPPGAFRS